MKKLKISDSELRMILILLALLLLAGAYFLGYSKLTASATELETQNDADQATVNTLENMARRQSQVIQDTEDLRQHIQDIVAKYPADLTTEKAIYIVQTMENQNEVSVSNISFQMGNLLMSFSQGLDDAQPPTGYFSTLGMSYIATYEGFKDMIRFFNNMEDRTTITTINAAYDRTEDLVSGSFTVNMYYLTGTGKEYEMPYLGNFEKGIDCIFGAGYGLGIVEGDQAADVDGETDAGEAAEE